MYHYHSERYNRRSIRLQSYDYSRKGFYFITICCQDRACLLGEIINGEMILNEAGQMIESEWLKLKIRFPNIQYHEYVIMPNHFHAILEIHVGSTLVVDPIDGQPLVVDPVDGQPLVVDPVDGQPQGVAPTVTETENKITETETGITFFPTVGDMMGAFKSITTVEYIRGVKTLGWQSFRGKLWQRNYYEHIIRNKHAFERISEYIKNNPKRWDEDKFHKKRRNNPKR